jgi:glycosyltransferase involved in cell wall biosynthesis
MVVSTLVSVIVPVHNGARFLDDALTSIAAQTHRALEIVVVDDGSTDGSAALADDFMARDGRGVVYRQRQGGVAAARNQGLRLATAPMVAFCDQDDVWCVDKLERQLRHLDAHPDVGVVRVRQEPFFDGVETAPAWLLPDPIYGDLGGVLPCSGLFRRELFDLVGSFDETKQGVDDTDWLLRARHQGVGIDIIPEVLMWRRIHPDNLMNDAALVRAGYFRSLRDRVDEHHNRA